MVIVIRFKWLFNLISLINKWYMKRLDRHRCRPAALRKAIKQARRLNLKTRKRFKVYFLQHKYQVLTRQDIQQRKKQGVFFDHMNCTKMEPLSFFDTMDGKPSDFAADLLKTRYSESIIKKL